MLRKAAALHRVIPSIIKLISAALSVPPPQAFYLAADFR
jgi:hypothetical protein